MADAGPSGPSLRGLLDPGSRRGLELAGDEAVCRALVRAEVAWAQVLADGGWVPADLPAALLCAVGRRAPDLDELVVRCADGGNPVIPLVGQLRQLVGEERLARHVHRGLTSQDVLDTALVLVVRDVLDAVLESLQLIGDHLAELVLEHRETVMVGRTLTQHAVPTTFALRAAQWLASVIDAHDEARECRAGLPVQFGGAAGTLAGAEVVTGGADPDDLASGFASALDLRWPGIPWHTRRRPVTRIAEVLGAVVDALGHLGSDVAVLARPEIGEVMTVAADGRGGSSAMPHKNNPVAAVVLRSTALQAGPLVGVLHQCAALMVDDRADGAWHAEWPTLQRLCLLTVTAVDQALDLLTHLDVRPARMGENLQKAGPDLFSEWRSLAQLPGARPLPDDVDPRDAVGAARVLADDVVGRWRRMGR